MTTTLEGKVAFITGASQGIGLAIAHSLHAAGATVALAARSRDKLDAQVALLGKRAMAVTCDVIDGTSIDLAVAEVSSVLGPIDIAVNNAGGAVPGAGFRPFADVPDEDWISTFERNILSAVRVSRLVLPGMVEKGWGRIINISSESGEQPDPIGLEYMTAKGGLNVFGKALSRAYGSRGIRVNTVSPGFIDTAALRRVLSKQEGSDKIAADRLADHFLPTFRPNISVGRAGTPEDVAAAVVFLASDAASYINGAILRVDGGSVIGL